MNQMKEYQRVSHVNVVQISCGISLEDVKEHEIWSVCKDVGDILRELKGQ